MKRIAYLEDWPPNCLSKPVLWRIRPRTKFTNRLGEQNDANIFAETVRTDADPVDRRAGSGSNRVRSRSGADCFRSYSRHEYCGDGYQLSFHCYRDQNNDLHILGSSTSAKPRSPVGGGRGGALLKS